MFLPDAGMFIPDSGSEFFLLESWIQGQKDFGPGRYQRIYVFFSVSDPYSFLPDPDPDPEVEVGWL